MKKLFVIALLLSATSSINAQTLEEWFQQKKTQKKYLLQQISAFKMYSEYLSKGYNIATQGLHAIRDITNGDFNLHSDYFSSLMKVDPRIKRYTRTIEIISLQLNISKEIIGTINDCKKSNQLTKSELSYIQSVFHNVLNDCAEIIDLLQQIITDNQFSMKEDERIAAINRICEEMQDNYSFTVSFGNSTKVLCAQRDHEKQELFIERKINGLK